MWENRYRQPGYLFGTAPTQALPRLARHLPEPARVLSVAEGEGRNAVWLAGLGHDVTGVEMAPSAVAKAQHLAEKSGAFPRLITSDVFDWDWPESLYDAVLGLFIQFLPPVERRRLHGLMAAATRPGGVVILHGYRLEQLAYGTGGPPYREFLYTTDDLAGDFAGWEIVETRSYEADLEEGPAHVGRSALLDFVARKPGG